METDEGLRLISLGEGQNVEFKTSFAEQNAAIVSLGAFANGEGGTVFIGVRDDGTVCGADVSTKRLENFVNTLRRESQPPLSPTIEVLDLGEKTIVAVTTDGAQRGRLFHVFRKAMIRVGPTNQVMSPDEQRARFEEAAGLDASDGNRPRFGVEIASVSRGETAFSPEFAVSQFSGDPMAAIEWRIRGPRFGGEWHQIHGARLAGTKMKGVFDLSQALHDDTELSEDEMGLEIRFYWGGSSHSELHRWGLTRKPLENKVLWDIGDEVLPPGELHDREVGHSAR